MTLSLVPVWIILTFIVAAALIGVLLMLFHTHHGLKGRISLLTPYSEEHATNLQRRVERIVKVSGEQRETLARSLKHSDEISAETRAMRAVLEAEEERDAAS